MRWKTLDEFICGVGGYDGNHCEVRIGDKRYKLMFEEIKLEEPRWWCWLLNEGEWAGNGLEEDVYMSSTYLSVYGTTADRDDKRDTLLAAARAAGRP